MASTSITTSPDWIVKHDVYINFRSKDTRRNFAGHLQAAFTRNGIDAFQDDRLGEEEEISQILADKISESPISVVIFSHNYSESPCCLDELVKIIECKENIGQIVLPVFLGVEPTHVRKQVGVFGDGFNRLIQDKIFKDKEQIWRNALKETANLSGWDSKEKSENQIVEQIVNRIEKILDQISTHDQCEGFVGISRVEKVESLLCIESSERVSPVGIWGMGGIGKTAIAKLVFSRLSNKFDGACYVANVRANVERHGLDYVQKDMILQLLGMGTPNIGPYMLSPAIRRRLQRQKLLIVLDDVDNPRQLNALLGRGNMYGSRSRIVVTSRDRQVLKNGCGEVYEVEKLNNREALTLFKLHAFKQIQPTMKLIILSKKAISYAQGLPLALEVLGCNLYGRDLEEWEIELTKLEEIPDIEVTDILRISYDGLDKKEKNIFLDIACLFHGWKIDRVEAILDGCGFYAGIGLSRLFDKALMTTSNNEIWMHDLLLQMGQNIVLHECLEDPGQRSRLWRIKDVHEVLTRNMGTEKVEVMTLDLSQITSMQLQPAVFEKMFKLRVLNFHASGPDLKIRLPEGLKFIPDELRYLHWDNYPLKSLPPKFHPEHLVDLDMRGSHVKQLWCLGDQPYLPSLKFMDLCFSNDLITLPNFSRIPVLERLVISHCKSLVEVPASVLQLGKLKELIVEFNKNLSRFPSSLQLTNLKILNLHGCQNIAMLSEMPPNVTTLFLGGIGIKELPPSIGRHSQLEILTLDYCKKLENLPSSICRLKRLEWLSLRGCSRLESLPENMGNLISLKHLGIDGTAIRSLPESLKSLKYLLVLRTGDCWNLNKLPENFGSIETLQDVSLNGSASEKVASSISLFGQYMPIMGYKCNWVPSFTCLSRLNSNGVIPEHLVGLVSLVVLDLRGNNMRSLPASIKHLPSLVELYLKDCKNLTFIPELPQSLELLDAVNCTSLKFIQGLSRDDQRVPLRLKLDFGNCFNLDRTPRSVVMMDTWMRIESIAMSQLMQEQDSFMEEMGTARLCLPGAKVPEWFEYSETGSILKVRPFRRRTLNLRRLAFGAVVVAPEYGPADFHVMCSCLFITDSGMVQYVERWQVTKSYYDIFPTLVKESDSEHALKSKHVFLGCDARECDASSCYFTEAGFKFYVVDYHGNVLEGCQVIACGVTPMDNKYENRGTF